MKLIKELEDKYESRWDTLFSGIAEDQRLSLIRYCVRRALANSQGPNDSITLREAIHEWKEERRENNLPKWELPVND